MSVALKEPSELRSNLIRRLRRRLPIFNLNRVILVLLESRATEVWTVKSKFKPTGKQRRLLA